jgi:type I restriction enzyme S subunit
MSRPVREGAGTVTAFRDGDVVLRSERRTEGFTESILDIGYQGVEAGDLVVHSMDGFAGAIGVSRSRGKMSPVVHVYTSSDDMDLRFVQYYLRHLAAVGYVQALAKGIRERSTSFDPATLADVPLPLPPLVEQRRIADFLDNQVARVDGAIKVRREQGTLLGEMKVATRASVFDRHTAGASKQTFGNLSVVGVLQIGRGSVISKEDIAADPGEYPVYSSAQENSGSIGAYGQFMFDEEMITWSVDGGGQVFHRPRHRFSVTNICAWCRVLRTDLLNAEYLAIALQEQHSRFEFDWQLKAHPGVVRELYQIAVPGMIEQRNIVNEFKGAEPFIEAASENIMQQIELLGEFKRSLITAAVTGEFDVSAASGRGVPA